MLTISTDCFVFIITTNIDILADQQSVDQYQNAFLIFFFIQSRTGGGANTTLEPFVSAGVTIPAASISSIMVAARL
jgi:hypothetical protein